MLTIIFSIELIGIGLISIWKGKGIKYISLITSLLVFNLSLILWIKFNNNNLEFQFREIINLYYYNINLGLDGTALCFIILTNGLFPIIMLLLPKELKNLKENKERKLIYILFILIQGLLNLIFSSLDLLIFYISFELVLIPLFLLIGLLSTRNREKTEAGYRLFIYTFIGGLLMLITLILINVKYGSTNNEILLIKFKVEEKENYYLRMFFWVSLFIAFSIKIPIMPLHTWLPICHTEANTLISILLAGLILKLGSFGMLRYNINLFDKEINDYFIILIITISLISIIYGSLIALRQNDIKKIIAYSSIVHMSIVIIGIFVYNLQGIQGGVYTMISHGFISSALFLLIGILYKRYKTRIILYYKGLVHTMPLFSIFFLFFTFANISFPLTSSFIGEILILSSTLNFNLVIAIILGLTILLSTSYAIWLANRILFGSLSPYIFKYIDISKTEFYGILPLILFTLIFGIFGLPILHTTLLSNIQYIL